MSTGRINESVELEATPQRSAIVASGNVIALSSAIRRNRPPAVSLDQRLQRAGLAIATHLFNAYDGSIGLDGGDATTVHTGTIVGVLSTLAAENAQQAATVSSRTPLDVSDDGWVSGGPADGLLFGYGWAYRDGDGVSLTVWDLIATAAHAAGVATSDLPDIAVIVARAEANFGSKPCPILTVAHDVRPRTLLRPAAARHRIETAGLAADEGLCMPAEQALAYGAAIAQVLLHEPNPTVHTHLAAEVLIGAARLSAMPYAMA